jgi:hypothetical protein
VDREGGEDTRKMDVWIREEEEDGEEEGSPGGWVQENKGMEIRQKGKKSEEQEVDNMKILY